MIRLFITVAVLALPSVAISIDQGEENFSRWKGNMARHQQVLMHGVPPPYNLMRDRSPENAAKMRIGAALFARHCSSCHGWSGRGGGTEGFFLVPAPADLEWLTRAPKDRAEPYIYWSIAEGGAPFESDMPAFKQSLSSEDIWSLTAYLRAGMPYATP